MKAGAWTICFIWGSWAASPVLVCSWDQSCYVQLPGGWFSNEQGQLLYFLAQWGTVYGFIIGDYDAINPWGSVLTKVFNIEKIKCLLQTTQIWLFGFCFIMCWSQVHIFLHLIIQMLSKFKLSCEKAISYYMLRKHWFLCSLLHVVIDI